MTHRHSTLSSKISENATAKIWSNLKWSFRSCSIGKLPVYTFSVWCNYDYNALYISYMINFLYNPMIIYFSPFWVGPIHCEHCKFKLLLITKNIFLYPLQVLLHYQSLMHHLNGNKYIFISNMRPTWWKLILKFLQLTYTSLTAIAFPTPLHGTFILVLPRGSLFILLYLICCHLAKILQGFYTQKSTIQIWILPSQILYHVVLSGWHFWAIHLAIRAMGLDIKINVK